MIFLPFFNDIVEEQQLAVYEASYRLFIFVMILFELNNTGCFHLNMSMCKISYLGNWQKWHDKTGSLGKVKSPSCFDAVVLQDHCYFTIKILTFCVKCHLL